MFNLEILVPTYNRCDFLSQNIKNLIAMIKFLNLESRVSLLISNNASSDNTKNVLSKFDFKDISVNIYHQKSNVGLEKNALFCLEKSNSDFVMYLGDDDYINKEYLEHIIGLIDTDMDLSTIVPNFYNIDVKKNRINKNRDDTSELFDIHTTRFEVVKRLSWRAHQMSGLVFKREGIYESYIDNRVANIYPFIYFISKSLFIGNCYHIADFPVAVTSPSQENKDWNYGADGLLDNIFNNYKCIPEIKYTQRVLLEFEILKKQQWRYTKAIRMSPLLFLNAVIKSKNTTIVTKLSYSYRLIKVLSNYLLRKIK